MTQIASLFGACQQKKEGILASFPTAKIMIFYSDSKFDLNLVYKSFGLLEGVGRKKLWWRRREVTLIKREDSGLNDEKQDASRRCTNVYLN
jgi:hypothetical protein